MEIGVDESFRLVLAKNHLNDFESIWHLKGELVEEGNIKEKSGHSHVERVILQGATKPLCVYIKKQKNYATNFARFLHRTYSLCRREYHNIQKWHVVGLPTMEAVYCAEMQNPLRSILITIALEGYCPLDEYLLKSSLAERKNILEKTAKLLHQIHQAGWVHRCFFPKHVFVLPIKNSFSIKMIDLEKARIARLWMKDYARDLGTFLRRIQWQKPAEKTAFLDAYFGSASMTLYRRLLMFFVKKRAKVC